MQLKATAAAMLLASATTITHAAKLTIVGEPKSVPAGQEIEVRIEDATEIGAYYADRGMETTHLRIGITNYIYVAWMCSLTPYIPAHNTTITLTIPPSLGPSGQYYKLAAYGFSNPDTSLPATTANYVVQSDASIFYLTNGTGAWTPAETAEELNYHGLTGAGNADIPCEAYACARACAGKQVPVGQAWEKGSAWRTCLAECEGVFVDEERVAEAGYPEMEDVVVPERLPVPGEECEVDGSDLRTPCGESCCRSRQYCYRYESCLELIEGWSAPGEEEEEEEEETTTASARLPEATETAARTTGPADAQSTGGVAGWVEEQKKGGSAAVSLDWWALGAIVGVLGPIVGAMG